MMPCGAMIWWIGFMTLVGWHATAIDSASTLECHRRLYTYRAMQTDSRGLSCWDSLSVMSCWGRCDSNEISDWRFPYKRSYHPVCMHASRTPKTVILRHCDYGVESGTNRYEYLEATSCKCQACSSSDTSCEGLRYRGERSQSPLNTNTILEIDQNQSNDENEDHHFEDTYANNNVY
ncbi:thyrostimulin beta-5 subunit [Chrysoperla carnea]|uniref:thyrostimulin beta-5 subunit n=1 Tax=Chrysoperla carnea TaxID=189513 RepID=UPI001D0636EF|nr:thyrostimulin beta-5 subunit [Chrysoperla carnea]